MLSNLLTDPQVVYALTRSSLAFVGSSMPLLQVRCPLAPGRKSGFLRGFRACGASIAASLESPGASAVLRTAARRHGTWACEPRCEAPSIVTAGLLSESTPV